MPCQTATRCLATPAAGPDLAGPFEDPATVIMLSSLYGQDSPPLWRAASCSGARLGESGPSTAASCRPVPQTPTVLSEHMVWQRRTLGLSVQFGRSCQLRHGGLMPSNLTAHCTRI